MVLSSFYSWKIPDGDFLLLYLSDIYYMTIREIYIYYYERIENILLFSLILDSSYLAGVLFYAGVSEWHRKQT